MYPGERFQVSVIAFGQRNETVPSTVRSIIYHGLGDLLVSHYFQPVDNTCTTLNYTLHSLSQLADIQLHVNEGGPCSNQESQPTLTVSLYQTYTRLDLTFLS